MDWQGMFDKVLVPLVLCASQLWLNARFKRADEAHEEARADTKAKRASDIEWRDSMELRMDSQDEKIDAVLRGQCTQMRSDIIHKAHRYIDDLGCASTEEKDAFWAEYEDYVGICKANDVVNHFIDNLAKQVMDLPNRHRATIDSDAHAVL